ncbi:MAG: response regulator transcription factor [Sediminibacterium sp.]|jgi:FixJ family two-component response regulator|nr:response regulator [Chitinophagaceae bacterium]MCA6445582.1 response regulator [Chitinophagaceae bacterium]
MIKYQDIKKPLSVAILEDNEADFILIEDYLIETFKTVQIKKYSFFKDLKAHINTQTNTNIDLILLDLNLPDLSGFALIQQILSENIHVPIIVLTGYADLSLAKESLKLGVDDFLIKDEVTPGILHKSIEFAFSRSQYVNYIEAQNEKLRNIAWTQSHIVRAPLARILGIINFIETEKYNPKDLEYWLKKLKVSSDEMDAIVRKITDEAQEIQLNKYNE